MEERYRGVRFPHKTKAAVSGCTRECAEAQGKDFGAIAVDGGYNIFVCGNGGAKPRHADLLGGPWDEATSLRMLDRFLMYDYSFTERQRPLFPRRFRPLRSQTRSVKNGRETAV